MYSTQIIFRNTHKNYQLVPLWCCCISWNGWYNRTALFICVPYMSEQQRGTYLLHILCIPYCILPRSIITRLGIITEQGSMYINLCCTMKYNIAPTNTYMSFPFVEIYTCVATHVVTTVKYIVICIQPYIGTNVATLV